jgi:hypothetical protein
MLPVRWRVVEVLTPGGLLRSGGSGRIHFGSRKIPVIWDTSCTDYKDKKKIAWDSVSRIRK